MALPIDVWIALRPHDAIVATLRSGVVIAFTTSWSAYVTDGPRAPAWFDKSCEATSAGPSVTTRWAVDGPSAWGSKAAVNPLPRSEYCGPAQTGWYGLA